MTIKRTIPRLLGIVVLSAGFAACNSADESRAKYTEEGRQLLQAGELDKALLAFKNVVQIDNKDWESHYQIGEVLSKLGKLDEAFKEYNLVVSQDPNHVLARARLGELFLLGRNPDAAEKMADEALEKNPDSLEALVLKAGVQAFRNNNEAAVANLEKVLRLAPDDLSATIRLATLDARLEKLDQAAELLRAAIVKKSDNIPLRTILAGVYARQHKQAEAEDMLASIVKIQPGEVQYHKNLALFQIDNNQLDKAEATLRDAVKQIPKNDAAKFLLVDFLVSKRNPDVAIAELSPMIESNPGDDVLKFKLADVQLAKKDVTNAEKTLKTVINQDKLGPNGIRARNKLAAIYALTKRMDEAKDLIKDVLEANPRDIEALMLRGQLALSENRTADAIADFRSVLVDQPKNVAVLKMLANAHIRSKEDSLARESLEKVIALTPGDETAQLELTMLFLKAGQKDQGKQQIESLLKNNPNSLRGLEALFEIELSRKEWGRAQEIARRVQRIYSNDPTGFYMSGLGYKAENKLDASAEAFQQALMKKPEAIEPLNELIKVYKDMSQPDKALTKLRQLLKQQPDNFIAYNLLGDVYMDEKIQRSKSCFSESARD